MTFLFIGIGLGVLCLFTRLAILYFVKNKEKNSKEIENLSAPAQEILREYEAIPASSRPQGNMISMLKALDIKNGGPSVVIGHFRHRTGWNWPRCNCEGDCQMPEYKALRDGLKDIQAALAEQEYQIQLAGISGELHEVQSTIERMREEANLLKSITKEIS